MDNEMIERVAKAIYAKWEDRPNYAKLQMNGILAEELARAAIEAMRLPVGASSVPGGLAIEESMFATEDTVFHGAEKCWNAMLEDALAVGRG